MFKFVPKPTNLGMVSRTQHLRAHWISQRELTGANQEWALDFAHDVIAVGRHDPRAQWYKLLLFRAPDVEVIRQIVAIFARVRPTFEDAFAEGQQAESCCRTADNWAAASVS